MATDWSLSLPHYAERSDWLFKLVWLTDRNYELPSFPLIFLHASRKVGGGDSIFIYFLICKLKQICLLREKVGPPTPPPPWCYVPKHKKSKKVSSTNMCLIIVLIVILNLWVFTSNILLSVQKSFIHPGKHWVHIPFVLLHGWLSKQFPLQFCIQSFPKVPFMQVVRQSWPLNPSWQPFIHVPSMWLHGRFWKQFPHNSELFSPCFEGGQVVLQLNPVYPFTQPSKQVPEVRSQVLFLQYLLHCFVQFRP